MLSAVINAIDKSGDPRINNWFLVNSITNVLSICVAYLLFITIIGPTWMAVRKPFALKKPIMVYNFMQVIFSVFLTYKLFDIRWFTWEKFTKCQSVDLTTDRGLEIATYMYYYYLSKYPEFLDTIFFILRKKKSQVTFLHLYHHVSMPIWMWATIKFHPGGTIILGPLFNSMVHAIMYTYYFLAGLGPSFQKYLWWKRYITRIQMFQFFYCSVHLCFALLTADKCNISITTLMVYNIGSVFFFSLFLNFYLQSYKSKNAKQIAKDNKTTNDETKEVITCIDNSVPWIYGLQKRIPSV